MVADLGDRSVAVLPDHGRRLIAVVYADMAGYSRLIGLDDASTFERLREMRRDLIERLRERTNLPVEHVVVDQPSGTTTA